jgi:hypothetical protein
VDPRNLPRLQLVPDLTPAQQLVSSRLDAEGAFPSALPTGSVFLYRATTGGTDRWLVNPAGQVIDFERLQAI